MMKMKNAITALRAEGERHTELAKGIALALLQKPYAPDVEKNKRLAEDHLIRAEAFKTAASLISK